MCSGALAEKRSSCFGALPQRQGGRAASRRHTAPGTSTVNMLSFQLKAERRNRHDRIEPSLLRAEQHTFRLLTARHRAAIAALALLALLLPPAPMLRCDAARPPPASVVGLLPSIFDRAVMSCIRTR